MATLTPYLFFDGNCREVLSFYQRALGGELSIMTYGEAQGEGCPLATKDKVMHGALKLGELMLMASDNAQASPKVGDNVALSLHCQSLDEIETWFKALSDGGQVVMALHDAFWGARFGMFVDRFGIHWMLDWPKT